jgi:N-acetylglucosaminylphosphatidylinositol deacetylase
MCVRTCAATDTPAPLPWPQVVTFDAGGVSGHVNHVGAYRGVLAWAAAARPRAVPVLALETVSRARKFAGVLDVLGSTWSAAAVTALLDAPTRVHAAMGAHASQYVWFRRVFVWLSRYTWVNTLHRVA